MRRLASSRATSPVVQRVGRRIKVGQYDLLEIAGFEIDAEILAAVLDPNNRILWAFIHDDCGRVQPTAFTEDQVLWLEDSDVAAGVDA